MNELLPPELVAAARRVIDANRAAGLRVAVAESCTGGLISAALTEVAGCSDVFEAGFVSYADSAKQQMIGVSPDIIDTFGAVSEAVAWAMARGTIERCEADVAVAVTGIAGPAGGSDRKPIGTVVFARAHKGDDMEAITSEQKDFGDLGRAGIRLQAALWALGLLMPGAPAP